MNIPTTYAAAVTVPLPDDDVVKAVIETYFGGAHQPDATLNVVKMFAGTGAHFAGVIDVVKAIFGPDGINPKHRQMCMMRVAKAVDAPYEWQLHAAIGRNLGLSEDEIAAVASEHAQHLCVPKTYATRRYSWITPPARSRRRTLNWSRLVTLPGSGRSGEACFKARCGRCVL